MKRLFTVLAVLLVATALFAGVTVKAGGTFGFANFNAPVNADTEEFEVEMKMKSHGFGFGVGVLADVADNLAAYGEFNMVFPADAQSKEGDGEWGSVKEDGSSVKINFFSVSAGVAYKLDFDAVKLAVGGGVTLNNSSFKDSYDIGGGEKVEVKVNFMSIGLNALVDAKYMITENVGAGITLNPQLGLYDIAKVNMSTPLGSKEEKATGFKVGFAMPITVGVSYTF